MLNAIWIILQLQCEYIATKLTELMIDIRRLFGRHGTKLQLLALLFMLFFASFVSPVITVPKQSITFQIKSVINKEQHDIHSLGYE
ncbi:unnamed protein product [Rotaria socialis]|uniref:Uncharacterized protein n=2 Tax=Rotaria TaxID=231623 RepID=A0A815VXN5_9BILA|nr:unnamed protein product [Rotaria magnacalcarata]CAF3291809.1 unnamed protein product [Rotaria socialis]CAF2162755.1 unnamed protein product [Rotaria magnacalcarata]CAF3359939.1 unnamed protein product [Rotaria socialis]CAF3632895.1 unnamed protein product [Rotaria socialis]